jgi:proteasome accessory factor B
MAKDIEVSERLFNLTCALLVTRIGLTKAEIFSSVQGYKENFKPGTSDDALNRKFERDKVLLTESGIHWTSFIPKEAMDDNQEYRYIIANDDFVWPAGIELSSKQLALLNLAAKVWAKASLETDAARGAMRLRALAGTPEESDVIGIAPRLRTIDLAFHPLSKAIENLRAISFSYRKPGEEPSTRRVEPWSLQNIGGQWLLVAFDLDRQEPRNFLLRRITSQVNSLKTTFEAPDSTQIQQAIEELRQLASSQSATIRTAVGSGAWFHFNLERNQSEFSIGYMDIHLLADELMEYAAEIEIVSPAELQSIIEKRLEEIEATHA